MEREKVIKGLEEAEVMLIQAVDRGGEMAVMGAFKCLNRVTDALALLKEQDEWLHKKQHDIDRLCNEISEWKHKFHDKSLKEQESVEPRRINGKRNHFIKCGNCNYDLLTGYLFCPRCGKAVKWE